MNGAVWFAAGVATGIAAAIWAMPVWRALAANWRAPALRYGLAIGAIVLCMMVVLATQLPSRPVRNTGVQSATQTSPSAPTAPQALSSEPASTSLPAAASLAAQTELPAATSNPAATSAPAANSNPAATSTPAATSRPAPSLDAAAAGLAKRLKEKGGTREEWLLLARSYEFMGRTAEAKQARDSAEFADLTSKR